MSAKAIWIAAYKLETLKQGSAREWVEFTIVELFNDYFNYDATVKDLNRKQKAQLRDRLKELVKQNNL